MSGEKALPNSKHAYALGHGKDATSSHAARTAEVDAAFLLPHLKSNFRILDIGCGPGTITTSLCKYVPDGQVVGIDMSPQVLAEANERADNLPSGRPKNVEFFCMDVLASEYASSLPHAATSTNTTVEPTAIPEAWKGTFDVIYESQVLVHISNPVLALRNLKPLLKPGGMFALRDYDCQTFIFHPDPTGWLTKWGPLQGRMTKLLGSQSEFGGRDLHIYCREAGLDPEKMELSVHGILHSGPEARKWWGTLNAQRFEPGRALRKQIEEKAGWSAEDCESVRHAILNWIDEPDGIWSATAFEVIARV